MVLEFPNIKGFYLNFIFSLTTTVTTNITKELELKFHGRKVITQIVESSIQVNFWDKTN